MSRGHFAPNASKMTTGCTNSLVATLLVALCWNSAVAFQSKPSLLVFRARHAASGLTRRLNTRALASSLPPEALIAEEDGQTSVDEKPRTSEVILIDEFSS